VVEELSGEKIDIIRWSEDPVELCANSLNPADILDIKVDPENGSIQVIVPQDQLSLAIGKRGQNARLASKLIGWNIDIRGDGEPAVPGVELLETAEAEAVEQDSAVDAVTRDDDAVTRDDDAGADSDEASQEAPTAVPPPDPSIMEEDRGD
jgi:transcription termination/antitermination protein NusA